MQPNNSRYITEFFEAKSLSDNLVNDSMKKAIKIYVPPDYFLETSKNRQYPVIYCLHGYGGYDDNLLISSKSHLKSNYPFYIRIILWKLFREVLTFESLDRLINEKKILPFILVQPDGSLPLTHIHSNKGLNGKIIRKGSLYLNSPFTGNYYDYIFSDIITHIDNHYRTVASKNGRGLIGGSMGGYGAIIGGITHPDKFKAVFAISPLITWLDLCDTKMVLPIFRKIYGNKKAERLGQNQVLDILDTVDLVFSNDNRLIPSITRDNNGFRINSDHPAEEIWIKYDLSNLIREYPKAFKNISFKFNCEREDEYQLVKQGQKFHETLEKLHIEHEWEIYTDKYAEKYSPHQIGIGKHLLEGIQFCLQYLEKK